MKGICHYCGEEKEYKKNTHYLTDSIIKRCLNQDGLKTREKGLYFDMSSNVPFSTLEFQRNAKPERIQEILGREATEEEIEKSKNTIAYSSDNAFCSDCETKFSKIEQDFLNNIVAFKKGEYKDSIAIRKFFYLQLWRTAICDKNFIIPDKTKEYLKECLQNNCTTEEINKLPLAITYLETPDSEYTENIVGICTNNNPYIIIMNDFIIQMYDSVDDIQYDNLFGINLNNTYQSFINYNETEFKIQNVDNRIRKQFLEKYWKYQNDKWNNLLTQFHIKIYKKRFGSKPSKKNTQEFLKWILQSDDYNLKENSLKAIYEYYFKRYKIKLEDKDFSD